MHVAIQVLARKFSGSLNSAHCRTVTYRARPAFFLSYHAKVCASVGTVRGVDSMDRCGLADCRTPAADSETRLVFARHRIGACCA